MNDDVKVMGTEGIVATPAQQKTALDDQTYHGDPLKVRLAAYEPSNNKEAINNSFSLDKDWRAFLTDPVRNIKPNLPNDYRTYRQLESMWRKPEYASMIDAYGSDMAVGGQLLSDFVDWDKVSWWDKQVIGVGAARRGMQIGALRTKVADLEHNGADQADIDKAKAALAKLEQYAETNTRPYDSETANAFASFGVSFARVVPEMVATTLATGAILPTGGATSAAAATGAARVGVALGSAFTKGQRAANIIRGLKAGRTVAKAAPYITKATDIATAGVKGLAQAGIVYNDTYRVTMGDLYKRIKDENPGMTDEQAYDLADTSAEIQSIMESLPALVGLGARAATTAELDVAIKSVLGNVPKEQLKRAAFMRAFQEGANKEVAKRIISGWTKDTIVDTLTEVAQTAAENATMQIADQGGDGAQVLAGTLERLGGFVADPMNEKYADELNTLVTTLPAAFVFGGVGPSIAMAGRQMSKNSVGSKLSDTFNNFRFGAQMRAYTQDALKKGVAPEALKEQIRGMASRGDAPSSVYFDKAAVQQLADTDPEFRRAMDRLGVLKQLNESEGNGGVVEVDLADYNELVNGEQSGVLYQKIKDMVSFRLDSMTMSQLNEWIASTETQNKKEIQKAIADEKSVYNRTLKEFLDDPMFAAMTEDQRKANATLMQLVANRAAQSLAEPMTAEEWFEKNVLLTKGEPSAKTPTLQDPKNDKSLDFSGTLGITTNGEGFKEKSVDGIKVMELDTRGSLQDAVTKSSYDITSKEGNGAEFVIDHRLGIIRMLPDLDYEPAYFSLLEYENSDKDFAHWAADKINEFREAQKGQDEFRFAEAYAKEHSYKSATENNPIYKQGKDQLFSIVNENARLDDMYPEYKGDTIKVGGKERTVYNSNGDRIAKSKEALTNFWNWFGDSKVVDEQGRPLVVYHGTDAEFDTFDKTKVGKHASKLGGGFYTTNVKKEAGGYGEPMALYVSIQKPIQVTNYSKNITVEQRQQLYDYLKPYLGVSKFRDNLTIGDDETFLHDLYFDLGYKVRYEKFYEALKNVLGADGIINTLKGTNGVQEFVVPTSNQIKATDNSGSFDMDNPNIRYMLVGSRQEETVNNMADKLGKRKELDEARAIEKEAIDKGEMPDYEAIWAKTGWYKEPDTSWSYEISDDQIELKNKGSVVGADNMIVKKKEIKLDDLISHPELFKLLPTLKTINVRFYSDPNRTYKHGRFVRFEHAIYLNSAYFNEQARYYNRDSVDAMLDTLVHEIQHAVQWEMNMLNFSVFKGDTGIHNDRKSSAKTAKLKQLDAALMDIYELNKEDKFLPNKAKDRQDYFAHRNQMYEYAKTHPEAKKIIDKFVDLYLETKDYNIDAEGSHVAYLRRAFEVQARNTATRRMLTLEQRRKASPSSTIDIAGKTQVGTARGQNKEDLYKNTRELRVIKFSDVPMGLTATPTTTSGVPVTGEKIAGWFDVVDGRYVIGLTENWNAVTFSHEAFHMYSRVLQDHYNNGTMTSYWKAQAEKLFNSVEAKPDENGKIVLNRNQEELLAERFTTYLLKNEIQNPELNSIFALLRDAFRKTYKQFNMQEHQPDAKTKEAFAVIFGAQDVAIAEQRALGLVEIEKPEGVSQEAYDHYMSFILEARAKATHDMVKTFYRVEKYKQSKEYAKAYDEEYTRNLKQVEQETTFQIKALAKQLNTTEIPALLLAYNSTHGDALITEDDVVSALNTTDEATTVAESRTAEYMNDLIKEKFNVQDDQTLISKDAKNVALAKAFLMEALMNEGKNWSDFNTAYTDLLDMVENQIQKMPLSKLTNSRRWNQLESVYAQQYQMYASLGNKEKMALVRRNQAQVILIQNKMFEMNNRVDRFLEKFPKKLRTAQPQGQNTMSAESWDLLQSLMEQYGFKITDKRRAPEPFNIKLENWLRGIEESEYCPISNLRYFMPETVKGHQGTFTSMTVRQFEVLEHMATAINSVASREYYLITEDEKQRYDVLAKTTAERLQQKGIKPYDENDTWVRKHLGVLSNIVNPEPILKALFPEEVHRMLIRPFFSAAAKAESKFNDWNDRWNQMIKGVNLSNTKKQYSTGHVLSYNNVANLLLAMGNEHAYENWRLFLKLDESQAETIITEALAEQPALAQFANDYWKMMAETTDIMNDSYRQRYNKLFVKKQPRAFKIGEYEFTGGYVPETKLVSELPDDAGWESILMGELSNEKLLSDKPDGQDLQSIVDNTRSRLRLFARWGHVAPAFNNLVRFVQREDVGAAIGSRAQNYIRGWLRDYHTPAGDSAGLMHALMSATTTTVLGLRLPQALLQLSGVIPAMGLLGRGGIRYVTAALGRTLTQGGAHQVAQARKKSAYMNARYSDPVKTLFGVSKTEAKISETMGKFQKVAMSLISYMDAIVANTTWEASYRMSLDNGLSEIEAREKADQDVRLSQTDALTVSRARAMKTDWARIITTFSTYMMGMQSVVRGRIAEKEFYGAATFAMAYITISTMFEAMLKEIPMPWEPDDDENYLEKIKKRWYNDSVSTLGSTLYPIAGIGSYTTESFAQGLEKVINPDEPTLIDMYGMGSLSALNYAKQYPDAFRYGLIGIFNGDEDAQRKAVANFVGWFSAGGKRMVKDMMED